MKFSYFVFAILILAPAQLLAARPDATMLTCRDARALVQQNGAIVLSTGGRRYDRFVDDPSFCEYGEAAYSASVRTLDRKSCFVGFTCAPGGSESASRADFESYQYQQPEFIGESSPSGAF